MLKKLTAILLLLCMTASLSIPVGAEETPETLSEEAVLEIYQWALGVASLPDLYNVNFYDYKDQLVALLEELEAFKKKNEYMNYIAAHDELYDMQNHIYYLEFMALGLGDIIPRHIANWWSDRHGIEPFYNPYMYVYSELCWLGERILPREENESDSGEGIYHLQVVKFGIRDITAQAGIGFERVGNRILKFYTNDHEILIQRFTSADADEYAALGDAYIKGWVNDEDIDQIARDSGEFDTYPVGDMDLDSVLSVSDVVSLRSTIIQDAVQKEEDAMLFGDLDADGTVTVSDVVALRQRIVTG